MGVVIAEGLSAPLDYFLPARVLDLMLNHLSFASASITVQDSEGGKDLLFASSPAPASVASGVEGEAPFGRFYRVRASGKEDSEKILSLLGTSLGARLDSSRSALFARCLPNAQPLEGIAESVSSRFGDSQSIYATLCILDIQAYAQPLLSLFPLMNPVCLYTDIIRILATSFEAAGGLYISEDSSVIGLIRSSTPTDTELFQLQLGKTLRRFLSSAAAPSLPFLRSKLFEASTAAGMKDFLLAAPVAQAS